MIFAETNSPVNDTDNRSYPKNFMYQKGVFERSGVWAVAEPALSPWID